MTTRRTGLREQKKQATRQALCEAALRLALERGPHNVRVDDIAEAAGVSPRTYNNYFANREQAIVAAITMERETRVAAAVAARPAVRLADAVIDAIVDQYTAQDESDRDALLLIASHFALRNAFVHTATAMEDPLADAIAVRLGDTDTHIAHVLGASVTAAVRVTLERWLQPAHVNSGLVVPSGALPDLLRTALAALAPALDAAENRQHRRHL
ncbi:TetR/AcrR family transcriptional regulator [Rhodococcus erythropolis]|uniref:TetR/AcrR family transcriptional regulator n=1 Tax=Rhodococcus erythropolis TaxID=1833 RepID=UPI0003034B3E|nr:TetR/AcrR family transcriptional regulator [Rhodococcus erythropolis]